MKPQKFHGEVPVGTKVHWYPKSEKFENTTPRVGIVVESHPQGIVDLAVLPTQGGTIQEAMHVYAADDKRIRDHLGNISSAGRNRGFWEYADKPAEACQCECKCEDFKRELAALKGEITKLKKADK